MILIKTELTESKDKNPKKKKEKCISTSPASHHPSPQSSSHMPGSCSALGTGRPGGQAGDTVVCSARRGTADGFAGSTRSRSNGMNCEIIPRVPVLHWFSWRRSALWQRRTMQCRDDGGDVLWRRRWGIPSLQPHPLGRLGFWSGVYSGGGEPRCLSPWPPLPLIVLRDRGPPAF
jgi:hypothetical protein